MSVPSLICFVCDPQDGFTGTGSCIVCGDTYFDPVDFIDLLSFEQEGDSV